MTSKEYNISVDLYADCVYRFILKSIEDEDEARDIVQDTFEKLWRKAESVNFSKVKSYIFTAAYHTMIDRIRKRKRHTEYLNYDFEEAIEGEQYSDLNEILHQGLKQLPDIQKNVILLRDYEGYSYEEIGEITGLNESQVKVYIYRARKFLKQYIGKIEVVI